MLAVQPAGTAGPVEYNPDGVRVGIERTGAFPVATNGTRMTAAFGSGTIAYNTLRPDSSRAGIWMADADGTDARRLTGSGSLTVWSPDGTRIAYEEWPSGEIRVMDADGANARRLTAGSNPARSPDGKRIAFEEPDSRQVWVADADGTSRRLLTSVWGPVLVTGRRPYLVQRRRSVDDRRGRRQSPVARRRGSGYRMVAGRQPHRLPRVGLRRWLQLPCWSSSGVSDGSASVGPSRSASSSATKRTIRSSRDNSS